MWKDWLRHVDYTPAQRRVLTLLLAVGLAWLGFKALHDRTTLNDPPAPVGDRASEVADRLDPNTADAAELAALPAIGERRALALIARRERIKAADGSAVAFKRPQDLLYVEGFGPAIVEQIRPYLIFPTTQPSSMPGG